jgi:hypothetical protein
MGTATLALAIIDVLASSSPRICPIRLALHVEGRLQRLPIDEGEQLITRGNQFNCIANVALK